MFDNTKYIIAEQYDGTELPVIFPHLINHSDIRCPGKVVSAGFCQIFADGVNLVSVAVFGKSDSLKMDSRPEDKEIIEKWLNRWKTDY